MSTPSKEMLCAIQQLTCQNAMLRREIVKPSTDKVATHWWLTKGSLGADMEAHIIAAQDGVTKTR